MVYMGMDHLYTKDVMAHELGHFVVESMCGYGGCGQNDPIQEHLADVHAMAVDNNDWQLGEPGCIIRDWQNPRSVTTYCIGEPHVLYPNTFDELNTCSKGGINTRPDYHTTFHIPSTVLGHLLYRLALNPAIGRMMALEQAYRTLINYLTKSELTLPFYLQNLLIQAGNGEFPIGTAMQDAIDDQGFWRPAELLLSPVYSRPGVVYGWVDADQPVQVYYRKKLLAFPIIIVVAYIEGAMDQPGTASILESVPRETLSDIWGTPSVLTTCNYSLGPHEWDGPLNLEYAENKLYLFGHSGGRLVQAVVRKNGAVWELNDHWYLEMNGNMDGAMAFGFLFAAVWKPEPIPLWGGHVSLYRKKAIP